MDEHPRDGFSRREAVAMLAMGMAVGAARAAQAPVDSDARPDQPTMSNPVSKYPKPPFKKQTQPWRGWPATWTRRDAVVFVRETGEQWSRIQVSRSRRRLCTAGKIAPPAVFHDLRIVRHAGFLLGHGHGHSSGDAGAPPQTLAEVVSLLQRPAPWNRDMDAVYAALDRLASPLEEWPVSGEQTEDFIFACAAVMFVQPARSERARHVLGGLPSSP